MLCKYNYTYNGCGVKIVAPSLPLAKIGALNDQSQSHQLSCLSVCQSELYESMARGQAGKPILKQALEPVFLNIKPCIKLVHKSHLGLCYVVSSALNQTNIRAKLKTSLKV